MAKATQLSDHHLTFLRRFVDRGWIHGDRADPREKEAVQMALRKRWLRRELSEVHFTRIGREALSNGDSDGVAIRANP